MKILIVDDDKLLADEVKSVLKRHGHEAQHSECAKDAVALAETGDYDFVLLDYKMPEHDGLWFMKNVNIPRKTKTLLVTSYAEKRLINHMFKMGASGYLLKPFDEDELLWHLSYYSGDNPAADPANRINLS